MLNIKKRKVKNISMMLFGCDILYYEYFKLIKFGNVVKLLFKS